MSSEDPHAVEPPVPPSAEAPTADPAVYGPVASAPAPSVVGPAKPQGNVPPLAVAGANAKPWGVIVCVLFGLIVVGAVVLSFSFSMRDAVVVSIISFLAAFGVALAITSLIRRKRAPMAIAGVGSAAASAALGAVVAAGVALFLRSAAIDDAAVLDLGQAGLGAYHLGQVQLAARGIAWFGLLAVPGFSLGALGLISAYGERKVGKRAATEGASSPAVALLALIGVAVLFLGGTGATIAALVSPVDVVDHPMVPRLREAQGQLAHGDLVNGCAGLEALLPEKVVPRGVLAAEIPDYREFSHRCVTVRIDALPKGLPCTAAAGALLGSELVAAAHAETRVKHACDRPFD